ncbi:MAG: hypothetical protein M5U01_05355 [Ardenticatenaceae bacterium]|nr:hypothetical protein [Ardenticatenaceae bacterium]
MTSDPAADLDALLAARMHGKPLPNDADPNLSELVDLAESIADSLEDVLPAPHGLTAGRQVLVEAAARVRTNRRPRPVTGPGWRRVFAWGVISSLLLVVITLGSNVSASNSLPGDALYPVKRVGERVLLLMDDSATVREELDSRRQREALELLRLGRRARVRFSGELLDIHPNYWVISGRENDFTVMLDEKTDIIGRPEVGSRVRVEAETRHGDLIALLLEVTPRPRAPVPPPASRTPLPPPPDPADSPLRSGSPTSHTVPAVAATPIPTASSTSTVPPTAEPESRTSDSSTERSSSAPSATSTSGVKVSPTSTVPASRTPSPIATRVQPTATPSPTATRTSPTAMPSPTVTVRPDDPDPSPTATPSPSPVPDTPTPTVEPTNTPRSETVPLPTPKIDTTPAGKGP